MSEFKIHEDVRGQHLKMLGIGLENVPDDFEVKEVFMTKNKKDVVRGMHFQKDPKPQEKILSCLSGSAVVNVLYFRGEGFIADTQVLEFGDQIFVPAGAALGYRTLEDNTQMLYIANEIFDPELDVGIYAFDSEINLDWGHAPYDHLIMSDRDEALPLFSKWRRS